MNSKHARLALRGFLALVLMIGFYALAIAIAIGLAYLPYAELRYGHRLHIKLALGCLLAAGSILWAVLPRVDRFDPPGPRLEPGEHPELFRQLESVASAVQEAMPADVYLLLDVNAWVSYRGGIMGLGSRRVMGLGLPLLQTLTVRELQAVLAHEFGHYYGGDTALAPWVYKTRSMISRTLDSLEGKIIQRPFVWYMKMFLRITNGVSRQQEYSADAVAARVAGAQPLIKGLQKVHRVGAAFDAYVQNEVALPLMRGYRVPIAEGFAAFLQREGISRALDEGMTTQMSEAQGNPYDTHPPLNRRIEALSQLSELSAPELDNTPAIGLVQDVRKLEKRLLESMLKPEDIESLRDLEWKDVLSTVYLAMWKEVAREHIAGLHGLSMGHLAEAVQDKDALIGRFANSLDGSDPEEERWAQVSGIIGSGIAVALSAQGHSVVGAAPTCNVIIGGKEMDPFFLMAELDAGDLPLESWIALCKNEGLDDLDIGRAVEEALLDRAPD